MSNEVDKLVEGMIEGFGDAIRDNFISKTSGSVGSFFKGVIARVRPVKVTQDAGIISIKGMNQRTVRKMIDKLYNTTRVSKNIFIDDKGLRFYTFFAPDVYYTLTTLRNEKLIHTDIDRVRVTKAIKGMEENTWLKRTFREHGDILDKSRLKHLTFELFKHQEAYFNYYNKEVPRLGLRGSILSAAAGSGKSLLTLAIGESLGSDRVIIICPIATVEKVWEKEIEFAYKKKQRYFSSIKDKRIGNERFIICHYEYLPKLLKQVNKAKGDKVTIILDESHNLNTSGTLRTNTFLEIVKATGAQHIIPMSGTSLKAQAIELLPAFTAIDPMFTSKVSDAFKKIYAGNNTGAVLMLKQRLGQVSFTVEKKELGIVEPIVSNISIKFDGSDKYTLPFIRKAMQKYVAERLSHYYKTMKQDKKDFLNLIKVYKKSRNDMYGEVLDNFKAYERQVNVLINANSYRDLPDEMQYCNKYEKNVLIPGLNKVDQQEFKRIKSQVKYVELKVMGEAIGNIVSKARADCHSEMALHLDIPKIVEGSEKKVLIFTNNISTGNTLMKVASANYSPVGVFGETAKDLNAIVKRYTDDPKANPMVASFKTLGTGVPLTMANTVVIMDLPFREYQLNQAISRAWRIGQDTQVYVVYVHLDTGDVPNISTRSREIVLWAANAVQEITGVESPTDLGDLSTSTEEVIPTYPETVKPIYTGI